MTTTKNPPPAGTLAPIKALNWEKPTTKSGLEEFAPYVRGQLLKAMPAVLKGQADRLIRCLFTCCQATPSLFDCTPISLFGGLIQSAQLGLELGGPLGQAYLIPYSKKATFVLGYKGAISLAYRSSMLASMPVGRVRQGDFFEVTLGSDRHIKHTPIKGPPATEVEAYYVIANLVNGGSDFETFTRAEAVEFRDRYSSTRNAPPSVRDRSPWYDEREGLNPNGFDWMAIKTLIKRIGKRLPLSVEFQRAIELDDMADREEPQGLEAIVDAARPQTPEEDMRKRLDEAKAAGPPLPVEQTVYREPGQDDLSEVPW